MNDKEFWQGAGDKVYLDHHQFLNENLQRHSYLKNTVMDESRGSPEEVELTGLHIWYNL